uniref:Uncharacterized protein n=1 Tax=Anguilla anguilla TaxID=7936 RepID=A0A0E9XC57_ANGAN
MYICIYTCITGSCSLDCRRRVA